MLFQTNTFKNLKYYKFMRYAASKKCPVLPHSPLCAIKFNHQITSQLPVREIVDLAYSINLLNFKFGRMNAYIINIFGRECSSLAETVHPAALNDFSLAAL